MKKITIELSLLESTIMRELQQSPLKSTFPAMYDQIFQYYWLGVLVKHNTLALEVRSAEVVSEPEITYTQIEIHYLPKNKSDLVA